MKTFRLQGEGLAFLIQALARRVATDLTRSWSTGDGTFHVLVGTKHFLRTGSSASIVIVAQESPLGEAEVLVLATGGQTGLLGVTWGAHEAYEAEVERPLVDLARARGVELAGVDEPAPPAPPEEDTEWREGRRPEVRCPRCGMRGPPDKGECYYCERRLPRGAQ